MAFPLLPNCHRPLPPQSSRLTSTWTVVTLDSATPSCPRRPPRPQPSTAHCRLPQWQHLLHQGTLLHPPPPCPNHRLSNQNPTLVRPPPPQLYHKEWGCPLAVPLLPSWCKSLLPQPSRQMKQAPPVPAQGMPSSARDPPIPPVPHIVWAVGGVPHTVRLLTADGAPHPQRQNALLHHARQTMIGLRIRAPPTLRQATGRHHHLDRPRLHLCPNHLPPARAARLRHRLRSLSKPPFFRGRPLPVPLLLARASGPPHPIRPASWVMLEPASLPNRHPATTPIRPDTRPDARSATPATSNDPGSLWTSLSRLARLGPCRRAGWIPQPPRWTLRQPRPSPPPSRKPSWKAGPCHDPLPRARDCPHLGFFGLFSAPAASRLTSLARL